MTAQFFSPEHMTQIAEFYAGLQGLIKDCGLHLIGPDQGDLYADNISIDIRHADDWTVGRFKLEDGMLIFDMDVPEES